MNTKYSKRNMAFKNGLSEKDLISKVVEKKWLYDIKSAWLLVFFFSH